MSLRKALPTILLAAYSLAVFDSRAWIICIGADGHVAVETDCKRCCEEAADACCEDPGDSNPAAASRPCDHCTDIPLTIGATDPCLFQPAHVKTGLAVDGGALPDALAGFSEGRLVLLAARSTCSDSSTDPTLHRLRSTFLRC